MKNSQHKEQQNKIQNTFKQLNQGYWKSCPYFYFHYFDDLGPTWQARQRLRRILLNHLEEFIHLGQYRVKLSIPGKKPWIPFVSISISHCKVLGGFIFSMDSCMSIGLDIEEVKRVRSDVIARLSQKKEIQQAPTDALLWVAKESSFKCLPQDADCFLLSHVHISNWNILQFKAYSFDFQIKSFHGKGIAFLEGDLAIAHARMC